MEIMVRLAHKKYGRSKDEEGDLSCGEELQKLLDDNVLPTAFLNSTINGKARPKYFADADWFRRERLYFEEVDKALSTHVDDLLLLYLAYRDDEPSGGSFAASIFLGFTEFVCLLDDAKLFDEGTFTRREAKLAFVYSQMTTVDEAGRKGRVGVFRRGVLTRGGGGGGEGASMDRNSSPSHAYVPNKQAALRDAHDQSTFSEFLEGLCRCAEMAFDEEEDGIPWNAPLSLKVSIFLRLLLYGHRRVLIEEKAKLKKKGGFGRVVDLVSSRIALSTLQSHPLRPPAAMSSHKGKEKGLKAAGKQILKAALGKSSKKRKMPEQGPEYKRMEPKTTAALPKVDDFVAQRITRRKQRALERA